MLTVMKLFGYSQIFYLLQDVSIFDIVTCEDFCPQHLSKTLESPCCIWSSENSHEKSPAFLVMVRVSAKTPSPPDWIPRYLLELQVLKKCSMHPSCLTVMLDQRKWELPSRQSFWCPTSWIFSQIEWRCSGSKKILLSYGVRCSWK